MTAPLSGSVIVTSPIDTAGPAGWTVTPSVSHAEPPSSSVTQTFAVYGPAVAYVCVPATVPPVTADGPSTAPSPQAIVAVCVSAVPGSA